MNEDDSREEERIRLKYEVGRLASDLHSEKRGRERMLDRLAQIEKELSRLSDRWDEEKNRVRWTLDRIITIVATISMIIIEILRK